jgi:hypothetical protein
MIVVEVMSMPMHDWTQVDQGIYHAFYLDWLCRLKGALNSVLPSSYYALVEQPLNDAGTDSLALPLYLAGGDKHPIQPFDDDSHASIKMTQPIARHTGSVSHYYLRKQRSIAIRQANEDKLMSVVELLSPCIKNTLMANTQFIKKVTAFLRNGVHVSIIDPIVPTSVVPHGIHTAIWNDYGDSKWELSASEPLAVITYECNVDTEFYLEPFAVGMNIPTMPVFLIPGGHFEVPLEETYNDAFQAVPARWRDVIAAGM